MNWRRPMNELDYLKDQKRTLELENRYSGSVFSLSSTQLENMRKNDEKIEYIEKKIKELEASNDKE